MVDVDRRITTLNPSHLAGLRRLSARAAAASPSQPRKSLLSFTSSAQKLLKTLNTQLQPGLTEPEFALIEAQFGFAFPPDLKAVLSFGLPIGPGFPNWRSTGSTRAQLQVPIASLYFHVAKNGLWARSWGPRPDDPEKAVGIARNAIKRVPLLVPVFGHCYLPCNPSLSGNPVFFVDENRIFCCGSDLLDFFDRESVIEKSTGPCCGSPRWVEFWSDAVVDIRRRNSNSSSSSTNSPYYCFDLSKDTKKKLEPISKNSWFRQCTSEIPEWVGKYITQIGSVLREGGWEESDIEEIVHVSPSGFFEDDMIYLDNQAVLDALLLKADRFSDFLMKSGWCPEEVSDCLGFEFRSEKERRPTKKLSPELVGRFERLAQSVSKS